MSNDSLVRKAKSVTEALGNSLEHHGNIENMAGSLEKFIQHRGYEVQYHVKSEHEIELILPDLEMVVTVSR